MSLFPSIKSLVHRPGVLVILGAGMSLMVMGVSVYLVLYAGHSMLPGPLTARLVPAAPASVEVQPAPAPTPAPVPAAQLSPVPTPAAYLVPPAARQPSSGAAAPVQVSEVQAPAPAKASDENQSPQTDKPAGLQVDDYEGTASGKAILENFGRASSHGHGEGRDKSNRQAGTKKQGRED